METMPIHTRAFPRQKHIHRIMNPVANRTMTGLFSLENHYRPPHFTARKRTQVQCIDPLSHSQTHFFVLVFALLLSSLYSAISSKVHACLALLIRDKSLDEIKTNSFFHWFRRNRRRLFRSFVSSHPLENSFAIG